MILENFRKKLNSFASPAKKKASMWFFKTGKGQYGEGDEFIGVKVPEIRSVVKKFWKELSLDETIQLLHSKIHEERLASVFIMVLKFNHSKEADQKKIYGLYLENTKYLNNWDIVDSSAGYIVGQYLEAKDKSILVKLAKSDSIWERRIAMISTFFYIRQGNPKESFKIAKLLLTDKEDLIHKAVGWMLKEIGKNSGEELVVKFLKENYNNIPRTTLRCAIERMPKKKKYLLGDFS